ncbi:MAG: putative inorganic carbon transporter subunit DabA, partial [Planctomycetales bacterium]
ILASVPLVARILFPRLTARIRRMAGRLVAPPPLTELQLERTLPSPGPDGDHLGFSVDEMAQCGERLLRDIGLTGNFSPLVLVVGHGSASLNNPHNSAYNCGACGGGAGGPNARSLAQMLNDRRVRERLWKHGLTIPHETVFVGGWHNTCNDSITYYDLDALPLSHRAAFETAAGQLEAACDRNAHERCRRFQSAPLTLTPAEARRHVEQRAEDLAQTRPECGHATNALCIVGRRQRTRGLFMDRRAFLVSYDPTQDTPDRSILTRILQAVFPVCAGINLEYYFSYVDSQGWGCGTKLPHNVTSLLGVMDGAASDLRTGLPWQMVEIHEPVRLLFVIETTVDAMRQIMERQPAIGALCRNGWVQLAVLDPSSTVIQWCHDGEFHPHPPASSSLPVAPSSADWYRGWRDHLDFAEIAR